MILAQNHQQLLSGSKKFFSVVILIFILNGCGILSGTSSSNEKPKTSKIDESTKVDTIQWTKIPEDKYPPISSEVDDESQTKSGEGFRTKESYRVSCFIPFEINRMDLSVEKAEEIRSLKYLHYYAGVQMAMEDLEAEGISLVLDVYDSKHSVSHVKNIIENQLPSDTDVIVGPIKKDVLVALAKFGKENQIPVISPWYSSLSVTKMNPEYIQLNPFLTEHYRAITEHALTNFDASQIFLVGREGTKDLSRFKYFQEKAFDITEDENALQTFTFEIDSLTHEYEIFKKVIKKDSATVFILPNFSGKDAQYIYNVIRRINVEKMDNEVYVYGMPILHSMNKMTYEYYTNMNIRIVMSRFTNKNTSESQLFIQRYFRDYNDFPKEEAFEGYDNLMFLGRALDKYGLDFVKHLDKDDVEYLSTKFDIQAVYGKKGESKDKINYYENRNLRIIQFQDNQFTTLK